MMMAEPCVLMNPVPEPILGESLILPKRDDDKSKALREAMLMIRFADIIAKSNNGGGVGSGRSQEKKQPQPQQQPQPGLKRKREDEAEMTALIREYEHQKEMESRRDRENQRKAARLALELVERNVVVEDNFRMMKGFAELIGCSIEHLSHQFGPIMPGEDEDDDQGQLEEGEIQ